MIASQRRTSLRPSRVRAAGIAFVALWFGLGGMAHFLVTDVEMRIVPPFIPWPREAVLITGALELLGAAGLLWRLTRRVAGVGLIALTIAVTPAHFYMLQHPDLFAIPYWMLVLRIPLQIALLILIAWCSLFPASGPGHPMRDSRRPRGPGPG